MILDDFETLTDWMVWPEAWGGVAAFHEATSAAVGSGAIEVDVPGIVYRQLPEATDEAKAAMDRAAGLSFWVRGDGSQLYGALAIGPAGEGSWQHGFVSPKLTACVVYFPLRDTNWHQVVVPWHAFVPEGPHPGIGRPGGITPSQIRVLRIGHRWKYFRNYDLYPRHRYEVDHVELVYDAPAAPNPVAALPVEQVLAKLRRREPVRIMCLGDSITAGAGASPDKRYWKLLEPRLREHFAYEQITVEGWGIGGATMLDAMPWMHWQLHDNPPDLVTLMFGTNDSNAYPPAYFQACMEAYLDGAAAVTAGRSAILPMTTIPGLKDWYDKTDAYAEAIRTVARGRAIPCVDLHQEFKSHGEDAIRPRFADNAHLSDAGHASVANTLFEFLTAPR